MLKRIRWFLTLTLLPPLFVFVMKCIYRTLRLDVVRGNEFLTGKKKVVGIWHGDFFVFAPYAHYNVKKGLTVMTSYSNDGELLSRIITALNGEVVRGDERKQSLSAFRGMIKNYLREHHVVFALDGPLGPYHTVKPGVFYAAKMLKAPFVPIGIWAKKAWRFTSWDRLFIPKPFSRVRMVFGEPYHFPADMSEEDAVAEIARQMDAVYAEAENLDEQSSS